MSSETLEIPKGDREILRIIKESIEDKKGKAIILLDVRALSQITDYFVVAEGTVNRHLEALADHMIKEVSEKQSIKPSYSEESGDWLVIDFAGIMVHLMLPEVRERYKLEQLWKEGHLVEIEL